MAIKKEIINENERILKVDENEIYIRNPVLKDYREAKKIYNQAFKDALDSGAYVREQLDKILRDRGLWDDEKQTEYSTLIKELDECEKSLAKGGIKLSKARELALKMRESRTKMRFILIDKMSFDSHTAEAQAEQAQFDFLLTKCAVLNKNRDKQYFKNYDNYLERSDEPASIAIATLFSKLYYNTLNSEKDLPENKFLCKFKFVNESLRLVDENGKLINSAGHHIDENGRLIKYNEDDTYVFVDEDGNELNDDGSYKIEFSPFLDEDGDPIEEEIQEKVEKEKDVDGV